MQTAVDCKGSSSSSSSSNSSSSIKSTTTTTTTTTSLEAIRNVNVYTTAAGASNGEESNVLRHRANISHTIGLMDRTNGSIHYMESDEYLGSNVKCMSVTPSPSPQSSPSKQYKPKVEPLPIITAATAAIIIKDELENVCNITNSSDSSSKSNSNSNSASTTSSVINTPILVRNGNAFKSEANTKAITISSHSQDEENQSIATATITKTTTTTTAATATTTSIRESTQLLSINTKTLPIVVTSVDLKESPSSVFSSSTSCISSSSGNTTTNSTTSSISTTPASTTPASTTATPATISPTKSSSISGLLESELLQWQDMPQYLQFNPYVLKGYRPLQTFKGCLLSLFYWHNETINILTHAIPIVYILAIVPGLMPWESGYRFLSFCHVFGSVAPWCGSFVYHLFMNIERGESVYYTLLKLDMVGIWVTQSFGALPLVTATTFCFTYKWKWLIIASYCLMSLWGLYKALTASSPWQRRLCFALPFTMRSILTFLRTLGVVGGNDVALPHVYLQDAVSLVGGAIGAMRIPEKWFPGLVDFYLNSHNIMHVLVVVAVYSMHKATIKDFEWMSTTDCNGYAGSNATGNTIETIFTTNIEL
ncbi:uncharacterized protein DDB_G0271670 [Glossina fuscipes]|uniref:Uncharacterized protein DDB_G0271670 n=2 Tax=Nemorhina TaxID=44051 RepID=A0A8U0WHA0_9MUSC|nr:uncharacterized protein DDB_G0271670 [Glossina fuscipes]XP_037884885.1 uncharacterized protein DDB_G0271670 [Glossina fuscipes]XP_037884886.1 uncharacterized protein DDB_G0271670 [Glossina fuscipes]XP_037884887.1 uncharacterized protein DDB_G0271670 [Glossina fuscipes]